MRPPEGRVEVALPLPVPGTFTYSLEGDPPASGTRVLVPFRGGARIGWVVGLGGGEGLARIRPVLEVLEDEPSLSPELLELSRWIADYYLAPLGLVLRTALPAALSGSVRPPPIRTRLVVRILRWLSSLEEREGAFRGTHRQREAYELLESSGGSAELSHLMEGGGFSRSVIAGLERKGVVAVREEEVLRDPFRSHETPPPAPLTPTAGQEGVLRELKAALARERPTPALLHGVTGSGKTLVYIELLREAVLERGMGAIVLVPEISLTPQTVSRFRGHFGDQVAVLHSALSEGERFDAWRQLRSGEKRIAVGARSAVFAPVHRLGVLVVDEEHDGSYKQSDAPRYHARDVAVVRAARRGALCVLGSATPSLESWSNAQRGKFRLLSLPERVGGGVLPPVEVVDLRTLRRREKRVRSPGQQEGESPPDAGATLSPRLVEGIRLRLARKEQVILLLNRRGYSNFVQCRECGEVWSCPRCSVSLTYHRVTGRLLCHYCRHEEDPPTRCPRCGSPELGYRGVGTEQVEGLVAETFPGARIARMDVDTTSGKWAHHEILGRFGRGDVDILLGTQMIAKGLDFPRVTLVGVVNADVGLHLPDFRASERTFQLLSQVAGRTGRGVLGGEVVIQTSLPEHYILQAALAHNFLGYAARELEERRDPPYPPHTRLVNVVVSSPLAEEAAREAERGARWVRRRIRGQKKAPEIVGPAPSPIERLHGRWRWHFMARSPFSKELGALFRAFQEEFRPRGRDVRVALDRDPVALL